MAFAAYMNSGRICMCADRVLVQRPIADEVTSRLAEKAAQLPSGDPRDPATVIGPLINAVPRHASPAWSTRLSRPARRYVPAGDNPTALFTRRRSFQGSRRGCR